MFNLKEIVENQSVEAMPRRLEFTPPGKTFLYGLCI
jgi:hypothetical protein